MSDTERAATREAEGLPESLQDLTGDQLKKYLAEPVVEVSAVTAEQVNAFPMESQGEEQASPANTVVNTLKDEWDVIKDGTAPSDISRSLANAVPEVADWQSLTDATGPNVCRVVYRRDLLWPFDNHQHVDLEILLNWEFGARYHAAVLSSRKCGWRSLNAS